MGEIEAEVLECRAVDVHGVGYADVTLVFPGGVVESARLGRESIPVDLLPGERVMVTKAVNVIVAIRRA